MNNIQYYCGVDTYDAESMGGKCAAIITHKEGSITVVDDIISCPSKDFNENLQKLLKFYKKVWIFDEHLKKLVQQSYE